MSSLNNIPKFIQEEEDLTQEWKEIISTLPKEKGLIRSGLYQYQGFWCHLRPLVGVISCQKHFQAQDSDIFLVSTPKSGTTWLKAVIFTLLNREQYPLSENHPLHTRNPHDLVPFLENKLYTDNQIPDLTSIPSPRLFATHIHYASLPESVKNNSTCKFVYLCRDPKDVLVSMWHFANKLRREDMGKLSIGDICEMFCRGVSGFGPYWDQVLEYWKQSKENPDRVFFLKFEDMKEQPAAHLRRLAEFLDCPFSTEEEESGLVEEVSKFCSFDSLSNLEINKNGKFPIGMEHNAHFRRGEVGDWKNHLSAEMAQKLDQITKEKFFGSGLVL